MAQSKYRNTGSTYRAAHFREDEKMPAIATLPAEARKHAGKHSVFKNGGSLKLWDSSPPDNDSNHQG